MIYIASPYTHRDVAIERLRYHQVFVYANSLMNKGTLAFSPIVYGHQFLSEFEVEGDYLTWRKFNLWMLKAAETLHVLELPGWDTSVGVRDEIKEATAQSKPIKHINLHVFDLL